MLFVEKCILVKVAVQCTLVKCNSILVKCDEFKNSYSLLFILFKSWLCCSCSLATLPPQQSERKWESKETKKSWTFQKTLLRDHTWLCYEKEAMFCYFGRKYKKTNPFVLAQGCIRYRMNFKTLSKNSFKKQMKTSLFQILDNEDSYLDIENISSRLKSDLL